MTRLTSSSNSTVLSVFAIVILSVLALLYRTGHEEFTGGVSDPDDGKAVSGTIFTAVLVYVVRAPVADILRGSYEPPTLLQHLEGIRN
jgi:hypothetical protein